MELMSTKVCDYRWLWQNKPGAINHQSFSFWKHYRFWFVFFSVPNFQPLTCDSKVSLFSWRKRRKINCLILDIPGKYEKNNSTYHSCNHAMWRNWTELYGILIWASWVRFPDQKKQSLKGDDTRNLTFCDYYCFCRKFCFVLALKSDEMFKSLCSGKVCIWRENVIFMRFRRVGSRKFR